MTWSEQQSTAVLRCSPLSVTRLVKIRYGKRRLCAVIISKLHDRLPRQTRDRHKDSSKCGWFLFHTQKLSSNIGMRIKPTLQLLLADLGLELVMTYSSAGCEHRRLSLLLLLVLSPILW
jgi:hypothetical protein